ncbi:MAG: sulfatase-like hydrolase/transferase [Candidatus Glassbacteria bacterium]
MRKSTSQVDSSRTLLFIISLFFLTTAAVCTPGGKYRRPNVILISLDTVRADRLGCYGHRGINTPNIDFLAAQGVLFEKAIAPAPLTLPSHTTILTGLYPNNHGVRDNTTYRLSEKALTLAEILKENGYRTAATVGAFVLDSSRGLDQGFDYYDDELPKPTKAFASVLSNVEDNRIREREVAERTASVVTRKAISWLRENSDEKFFLWIHYFDPHYPYTPPPPYSMKYRGRPYYGEIAFVDENIGSVMEKLRDFELIDNTLVIIVGDHGESLGEHKEYTHCIFIYDSTTRVPLIMSWPGRIPAGVIVNDVVSLADVLPTILEFLEIGPVDGLDGVSLVDIIGGKGSGERFIYSESLFPYLNYGWSQVYSLRGARWKYIKAPEPELYDMSRDRLETKNLFDTEREVATRLAELLETMISEKPAQESVLAESAELSTQDRERLESLGYISGAPPVRENASLRDPKEMIALHDRINISRQAMREGRIDEALGLLEEVIAQDPTNALARNLIGMIYNKLQDIPNARAQFQKAVELNPNLTDAYCNLGNLHFQGENYSKAAYYYEKALELEPSAGDYCLILAEIYSRMGDDQRAEALYRRANELGYSAP